MHKAILKSRGINGGYSHLDSMVKPVIEDLYERQQKEQQRVNDKFYNNFLQRVYISVKLQEVKISIYENASHILVNGKEMPSLIIILGRLRLALMFTGGKVEVQLLLEDIKIADTVVLRSKKKADLNKAVNATIIGQANFDNQDMGGYFKDDREGSMIRAGNQKTVRFEGDPRYKPTRNTVMGHQTVHNDLYELPKETIRHTWKSKNL